ncbi:MAG: hypothetical protein JJU29_23460 [Verrucomicrobia bacterium]|nr:hypothetical protein [Verrucomicrobiota bacterium]
MIFRLTPFQCQARGPDHLRALAFFDSLIGHKLIRLPHLPEGGGYPSCTGLDFEGGYFAMPLHDADNSPGPVRWQILDANGMAVPGLDVRQLVDLPVTAVGFFQLLKGRERTFLPYLRIGDDAHLTCIGSKSGGVISLERDARTEWLYLKLP